MNRIILAVCFAVLCPAADAETAPEKTLSEVEAEFDEAQKSWERAYLKQCKAQAAYNKIGHKYDKAFAKGQKEKEKRLSARQDLLLAKRNEADRDLKEAAQKLKELESKFTSLLGFK